MNDKYEYLALSAGRNIRILLLNPAQHPDEQVHFRLQELNLDLPVEQRPRYEALSYVWGYRYGDQQVLCDGRAILVTKNCLEALRHLRRKKEQRNVWVDAICIDQSSNLERTQQVQIMGDVYKCAEEVIVWLGAGGTDTPRLMRKLRWSGLLLSLRDEPRDAKVSNRKVLDAKTHEALRSLVLHDWFRRAWTGQEIVLSQRARVFCGSVSLPWTFFIKALELYLSHFEPGMHVFLTSMMQSIYLQTIEEMREGPQSQDNIRQPHNLSGMSILSIFSLRSAFDPRDKIFALNNIFKGLAIATPIPDYTKDIKSIFEEATIAYIQGLNSLKLLEFDRTVSRINGLPSWVPDFTSNCLFDEKKPTTETLSPSGMFFGNNSYPLYQPGKLILKGKTLSVISKASGNMPAVTSDCLSKAVADRRLKIKILWNVFAWGYIVRCTLTYPLSKDKMLQILISLTLAKGEAEIQVLKDFVEGPIATLILRNPLPDLEDQQIHRKAIESAFQGFCKSFHRMPDSNWSAIFVDLLRFGTGKAMFLTNSGHHGFTKGQIEVNDLVVLFCGSIVPMILRPKDGCYQLIGTARVPELSEEDWPTDQEVNKNSYVLI